MQAAELKEEIAKAATKGSGVTKTKALQQVQLLENDIYEGVKDIMEHYKEGVTTQKELLQIKDYYFKKKYIQGLQQQLIQML